MQRDNSKGVGSGYTTLFREYDPEIARWKSLDPKTDSFPSISPFAAFNNNPLRYRDVWGDDINYIINDVLVASIKTHLMQHEFRATLDLVHIPSWIKPIEIDFREVLAELKDYNAVGIGLQIGGEFTVGAGGGLSYTLIDFTKGKDKDNGIFGYVTGSGKAGVSIGGGISYVICRSDKLSEIEIDRNTPTGPSATISGGVAIFSAAGSYSMDSEVREKYGRNTDLLSVFKATHTFYTRSIGVSAGPSSLKVGLSVSIDDTILKNHYELDLFHGFDEPKK